MKRAVIFIIVSVFFISCAQEQYVYENVGTTQAILVKNSHNKNTKQVHVSKKAPKVKKYKKYKKTTAPKNIKSLSSDNMGTQDTDWADIGTYGDSLSHKNENVEKVVSSNSLYSQNYTVSAVQENKCKKVYHIVPELQEKYDTCTEYDHEKRREQVRRAHALRRYTQRLRKAF